LDYNRQKNIKNGGIHVDTLEFSQRLIMVLDDGELRETLKKAAAQGFSVQGFKNPWKAPRPSITKCLERKKRGGKYYYMIILEAIASLINIEDTDTSEISAPLLAKQWLNNKENLYEKIEKDLKKFEENSKTEKVEIDQTDMVDSVVKLDFSEEKQELQKKNEIIQEKNKKLQSTIQGNKIEISNLKKSVTMLEKANEKLERELSIEKNECDFYINEIKKLTQNINDKDEYIRLLLNQIDELKKYKECAPKIACFIKAKIEEGYFGGYDITYFNEWSNSKKSFWRIDEFDEIWIVHKGFSYNDITEIKNCVSGNVKEFLSIAHLKNKVGGRI
jgi:hypothetical protein